MTCTNCGEEMECGILLNNGGGRYGYTHIRWLPKEAAIKRLFLPFTKKGVNKCGGEVIKLYNSDIAMPKYTDTYICKKCRKLIVNY
ncbi:MAG: PF20097 family protein [Clostridium sp.]|nr:PF20097 family protein [Clostridium sp.]MCM1546795.1 PF20097 family protein [Ruminococcus sp.]